MNVEDSLPKTKEPASKPSAPKLGWGSFWLGLGSGGYFVYLGSKMSLPMRFSRTALMDQYAGGLMVLPFVALIFVTIPQTWRLGLGVYLAWSLGALWFAHWYFSKFLETGP